MHKVSASSSIGCALAVSALVGCDDADTSVVDSNLDAAIAAYPATGAGSPPGEPLYAITTQLIGEASNSYIVLTPTLTGPGELTLDSAVEIPGRAIGVGLERGGAVFAGSDDGPALTRYELEGASLRAGPSLSFQALGISSIFAYPGNFQFVSATKAYYFDGGTGQIVVWNPTTMSIERTLDIEAQLAFDGYQLVYEPDPTWRGEELVLAVSYYGLADARYPTRARIVLLNTSGDGVRVVDDGRCPYLSSSVITDAGDIYLASDVYAAAVHQVLGDEHATRPCMVRIKAGEQDVDPTFVRYFDELTGVGSLSGSLVPAGGQNAYIRLLDPTLADVTSFDDADVLWGTPVWRWASISLGAPEPASLLAGLEPAAASVLEYSVDGRSYVLEGAADFSRSSLLDLGAAGGPVRGVAAPGAIFSVVRVR